MANSFYVPIEITFSITNVGFKVINNLVDATFIIDILINFRTIVVEGNKEYKDCKTISMKYMKSLRFYLDIIASIPLEPASEALG